MTSSKVLPCCYLQSRPWQGKVVTFCPAGKGKGNVFPPKVIFLRVKVMTFLPYTLSKGKGNAYNYQGNNLFPYIFPFKEDPSSRSIADIMYYIGIIVARVC